MRQLSACIARMNATLYVATGGCTVDTRCLPVYSLANPSFQAAASDSATAADVCMFPPLMSAGRQGGTQGR
jgi:hypothetical protein